MVEENCIMASFIVFSVIVYHYGDDIRGLEWMEVKNVYKSLVRNLKVKDHTDDACVGNSTTVNSISKK